MSSRNKKVIGVKVTDKEAQAIETYANTHNISVSALFRLFIDGLLNGDISVEKGELKIGVDPIGYAVSDMELRYQELGFERLLNTFERKNYPDNAIRQAIDMIIEQVLENRDYNSKRAREDWGA